MIYLWLLVGWIANESLEEFTSRVNDVCVSGVQNTVGSLLHQYAHLFESCSEYVVKCYVFCATVGLSSGIVVGLVLRTVMAECDGLIFCCELSCDGSGISVMVGGRSCQLPCFLCNF